MEGGTGRGEGGGMMRALALALLLVSVGARPAESALITIDHTTPFAIPGRPEIYGPPPSWVGYGVFGDLLAVEAFGGLGYFDRNPVATVWSLDVLGVRLQPLHGATIVSMVVSGGSHGPVSGFWVGNTHYEPGLYTVVGDNRRVAWTALGASWPWPPGTLGISQPLSIHRVTLNVPDPPAVPEPSGLVLLGGLLTVMARSLRRTRG